MCCNAKCHYVECYYAECCGENKDKQLLESYTIKVNTKTKNCVEEVSWDENN